MPQWCALGIFLEFMTSFVIGFYSQVKSTTKLSIVTKVKSYTTLITNDKGFWMKKN
jgi:hypothetical protein